ncbi:AP2 domain-containing protein [Sandarakinorhabdus glacialis]|nr:AP2 domain-containing protein [Polymorphobacter glacialis]
MVRVADATKRMFGYYAYATIDGRFTRTYFSDLRYGSAEKAHDAALEVIEGSIEDQRLYLSLKRRYHRRANSPGDVPGVNRVPTAPDDNNGYWIARWHDAQGRRRSRKFSVRKYGERLAYDWALQTRLQATLEERSRLCLFRTTMADFHFERPGLPA